MGGMCGRFSLYANVKKIKEAFNVDEVEGYGPNYNIVPSQSAEAITNEEP